MFCSVLAAVKQFGDMHVLVYNTKYEPYEAVEYCRLRPLCAVCCQCDFLAISLEICDYSYLFIMISQTTVTTVVRLN